MASIIITATLTEEQAIILAKEKGYTETVTTPVGMNASPVEFVTTPNTDTPYEFLKKVYESMIIADAQRYYIEYDRRLDAESRRLADEKIKNDVITSITSSVE